MMDKAWRVCKVEDIAAKSPRALAMGPFGSRITKNNFVAQGVPVIRGVNISSGRFYPYNFVYLSDLKADELIASVALPGDLVFTHRGTLGQVGIVPKFPHPRYIVSQSQMKLTCNSKLSFPLFMFYYFSSKGKTELLKHVSGSGVPAIASPLSTLRKLKIQIPPLVTQNKIAFILSTYDDLIENNLRRIKILEEMAQNHYCEWFVNFRFPGHEQTRFVDSPLGRIPEGWEVVPFTEIAEVLSGGTPKTSISDYWGGHIPFFAPKDTPSFYYVTETEKTITELGLKKCNSQLYPPESVLITARGTVGKLVLTDREMAMNQSCYALKGKPGISQKYLFFTTLEQIEYLKKNTGGATFDTIVVDTFHRMQVMKPTVELINKFTKTVDPFMGHILNLINKNKLLSRTRDLLLPKLISGELDVSILEIALPEGVAI